MLSSPRNPPSKTLMPWLSTLLTHHAKFISSFWKHFSRNTRVRFAGARFSGWYTRQHAQACTGGFEVRELPLVSGDLTVRVLELFEQQEPEIAPSRTPGQPAPARPSGTRDPTRQTTDTPTCPASTGSRIELRCRQLRLRMFRRDAGGGACGLSPSSQRLTSNRYICLVHSMPASAWRWISRSSSLARRRMDRPRRTRPLRPAAARSPARRRRAGRSRAQERAAGARPSNRHPAPRAGSACTPSFRNRRG